VLVELRRGDKEACGEGGLSSHDSNLGYCSPPAVKKTARTEEAEGDRMIGDWKAAYLQSFSLLPKAAM